MVFQPKKYREIKEIGDCIRKSCNNAHNEGVQLGLDALARLAATYRDADTAEEREAFQAIMREFEWLSNCKLGVNG